MSCGRPAPRATGVRGRQSCRRWGVLVLGLLVLLAGEPARAQSPGMAGGAGVQPENPAGLGAPAIQGREHGQALRDVRGRPQAGSRPVDRPGARPGFLAPRQGEHRFLSDEVVLDVPGNLSSATLEEIARRHHLTRMGSQTFGLTGRTLYRWRIDDRRSIAEVIGDLQSEEQISAAQPNYTFSLQDPVQNTGPALEGHAVQYAVAKLHLGEAHRLATGTRVPVAIIDSAVDASHPELTDVVVASFDAVGGPASPDAHGTGMAGAIAAHRTLVGA